MTLEAEAHALAGDERAALRALDEADVAMSHASEEDASRRPRVAFFDRARLAGERGVALARLERPEAAQDVLRGALSSLDPEVVKTRPRLLSALATAEVRQGNIDEACRLGIDALELAAQQQVGPNLQDVRGDPRVPRRAKVAIVLAALWLANPIDLIPEFLPVIGPLDDVVVVALALRYAARQVPRQVLLEAWPGDTRLLERLLGPERMPA